ncbi:hypothetical protein Tco_1049151 [Tanacetum coccineum]
MLTALTMLILLVQLLMLLAQMRLMMLVEKQALNFHLIQICYNLCLLWKIIAYLTSQEMMKMMVQWLRIQVSPNPTTRIHKDHHLDQVIRDLQSTTQTRKMSKNLEEHGKNPKSTVWTTSKHYMDHIKLLELGMKPCQHICWTMGFKEGKLTRPYSSKDEFYGRTYIPLGITSEVKQNKNSIFISQDKYVAEILNKFGFTEVKTTSTPMETQ